MTKFLVIVRFKHALRSEEDTGPQLSVFSIQSSELRFTAPGYETWGTTVE
jgi:hypothetical protein